MRSARLRGVGLGLATSLMFVGPAMAQAPAPAGAMPPAAIAPAAEAAHREGQSLLLQGKYTEAVVQLDEAVQLAPRWSAPVKARMAAFAALAERHAPSEAFLTAQASDLALLMTLEPGVDTEARHGEVFALRRQANVARRKEARRRKLNTPTIVFIAANISMLVSGALMESFIAAQDSLDDYGQRRYVYTGAAMLGIGAAMLPVSITLGVLAGRQVKRDSAVADFNVETGRRGPVLGVAPQYMHGGGGVGFNLRF